jgi:hypothetical protein
MIFEFSKFAIKIIVREVSINSNHELQFNKNILGFRPTPDLKFW